MNEQHRDKKKFDYKSSEIHSFWPSAEKFYQKEIRLMWIEQFWFMNSAILINVNNALIYPQIVRARHFHALRYLVTTE